MRSPALALGLSFVLLGMAPPDDGQIYKLKHKAHQKWTFVLPAERWHHVTGDIELPGGLAFGTEPGGISKLGVDTNRDGDVDMRDYSGFLSLFGP